MKYWVCVRVCECGKFKYISVCFDFLIYPLDQNKGNDLTSFNDKMKYIYIFIKSQINKLAFYYIIVQEINLIYT